MKFKRLIFVCTGNTCRSPMAEYIAKHRLAADDWQDLKDLQICSRGLSVCGSDGMSPDARRVLELYDIPVGEHYSRQLEIEDLAPDSLILTMTAVHKHQLEAAAISRGCRAGGLWTIGEFAGVSGDVKDPYGFGPEAYERCYWQLDRLTGQVLAHLQAWQTDTQNH